ncbi:MAG: zf-TFIIB domain-containing protein [Phycisphaerae bacterium]
MKCPSCNGELKISDRQGIEIDYCLGCRGVWLDRGELDKIIEGSSTARTHQYARGYDDDDDDSDSRGKHGVRRNRRSWLGEMFDFGD